MAAIDARKSINQSTIAGEQRSVARQVDTREISPVVRAAVVDAFVRALIQDLRLNPDLNQEPIGEVNHAASE